MPTPALTSTPPPHDAHRDHVVHRLAHAIYGLIVLAAVVGELSTHDEDMLTAILFVGGGALVLVFAHTYSQLVAAASMEPEEPPIAIFVSTAVDQLALGIPATVAVGLFALAEVGAISDRTAYDLVIAGTLLTLFVVGVTIGRHRRMGRVWSTAVGLGNVAVGLIIIGIEAAAAH